MLIISGEMDLSFPSLMVISGLVFSAIFEHTGSPFLGFLGAICTGSLAGLCNGLIVVKVGVPAIIATIGTQFFWRGASTLLSDGLAISLTDIRETFFHHLFVGRLFDLIPMQTVWCLLFAVGFWLLLNRHVFGDGVRFIGDNISTAQMMACIRTASASCCSS